MHEGISSSAHTPQIKDGALESIVYCRHYIKSLKTQGKTISTAAFKLPIKSPFY